MAMNGNSMGDAIRAAIDAVGTKTDRTAVFRAIGNAIVAHIQANASVSTTTTGVSTGGGTAPGTGTVS